MGKDKFLPHNSSAEKAVFSIILLNPERFIEIGDKLIARDFYHGTNQEIWRAMGNLYKRGQDIDLVSVKTEIGKKQINPKPAITVLASCYEQPVVEGNLRHFVKDIKNASVLRQIMGMTNKYMQNCKSDDVNALSILADLEKEVINISHEIKEDRPISAEGIIREIDIERAKGEESGWRGFETGFKWLDEQTGGLIPTQCWIVGAYTGIGKTFFMLQILLNVLKQGAKVMLFSTEMDRKMNMLRLVGNLAGLSTIKMLKGNLDEHDEKEMQKANTKLSSYKDSLVIYDNVYSVEEIRLKAKKKKIEEGLDIVFIDFIQNLRGDSNIYERMSNAAIALQQLAQELNITMVLASQVAQTSAGWTSKEAIEYKGAGEIAAIADVGLWIKKVEDDKSVRQVILRKVRHGIPGHILTRISFPSGRMIDMEESAENGDDIKSQL